MNTKLDGPLVGAFESDTTGVIKQQFVTYRVKDGMLRKETTTRTFQSGGKDWIDTSSVEPLVEVANA
jgi:hypothetical protein